VEQGHWQVLWLAGHSSKGTPELWQYLHHQGVQVIRADDYYVVDSLILVQVSVIS
jgi:hypothetical protein